MRTINCIWNLLLSFVFILVIQPAEVRADLMGACDNVTIVEGAMSQVVGDGSGTFGTMTCTVNNTGLSAVHIDGQAIFVFSRSGDDTDTITAIRGLGEPFRDIPANGSEAFKYVLFADTEHDDAPSDFGLAIISAIFSGQDIDPITGKPIITSFVPGKYTGGVAIVLDDPTVPPPPLPDSNHRGNSSTTSVDDFRRFQQRAAADVSDRLLVNFGNGFAPCDIGMLLEAGNEGPSAATTCTLPPELSHSSSGAVILTETDGTPSDILQFNGSSFVLISDPASIETLAGALPNAPRIMETGGLQDVTDAMGFSGSGVTIQVQSDIPEPSTLLMIAIGLVNLLALAWGRRRQQTA